MQTSIISKASEKYRDIVAERMVAEETIQFANDLVNPGVDGDANGARINQEKNIIDDTIVSDAIINQFDDKEVKHMIYANLGGSSIKIMKDFLNYQNFQFKDTEEMAWSSVVSWLSRLRLEGVPFSYIVPSEGMLPNDSIRFFHVDRNWLDALVDGALSVGIIDSRGALAATDVEDREELYQKLMTQLNERENYCRFIPSFCSIQ